MPGLENTLGIENRTDQPYKAPELGAKIPPEIEQSYNKGIEKINSDAITEAKRIFPEIRLELSQTFGGLTNTQFEGIKRGEDVTLTNLDSNAMLYNEFEEHQNRLQELRELNPGIENLGEDYRGGLPGINDNDVWEYLNTKSWLESFNIVSEEQTLLKYAAINYISREEFEQQNPGVAYDFDTHSPIQIMADAYRDRSEDDKLRLLQTVGAALQTRYDESLLDDTSRQGISPEQMWEDLSSGAKAGICGDIHKEVVKLGKMLGFDAELTQVNSGSSHLVMRGQRENGKFFILDYGNYIEADSLDQVTDYYHIAKNTIKTGSYTSDEYGNVTGRTQTELQKRTGDIIYISAGEDQQDDGIDLQLGGTGELKFQYSKSTTNTQFFTFAERMKAKAYGQTQDFIGVGVRHRSEARDIGFQGTYAFKQEAQAFSGYYNEKRNIGDTHFNAGTSFGVTFNENGKIGDGTVDIYTGIQRSGYYGNITGLVKTKNLGDNDLALDKLTLIPKIDAGYTGEKYSFGAEVTQTEQSLNMGIKSGQGDLVVEVTNYENNLADDTGIDITLRKSWLLGKGKIGVEMRHAESENSGKVSYQQTF